MSVTPAASRKHQDPEPLPLTAHAAERWAGAVVKVIQSDSDPTNFSKWGRIAGASPSMVRAWCRAAHIAPKAGLDFARVLRAVVHSSYCGWDLQNLLDIVDPRTLTRLFERGQITHFLSRTEAPSVEEFISCQRFVSDQAALAAVRRLLEISLPPDLEGITEAR
jgi:hypothetical protein